jgi:hypothetical protein
VVPGDPAGGDPLEVDPWDAGADPPMLACGQVRRVRAGATRVKTPDGHVVMSPSRLRAVKDARAMHELRSTPTVCLKARAFLPGGPGRESLPAEQRPVEVRGFLDVDVLDEAAQRER